MTKRTVILGGGESGTGAAVLAKKLGHDVFLSDNGSIADNYKNQLSLLNIYFEEKGHSSGKVLDANQIILSPGIPKTVPIVKQAIESGIDILSEIEFAAKHTNAYLIGITGTNGKTTTASIIYHILSKANYNVGLAGNVGSSFALQVANNQHEYYVLELSSFQLDSMYKTCLNQAVLLNISPDHLDRYENFEGYIKSKFRIAQNQTKEHQFIYCADDKEITSRMANYVPKANKIPFGFNGPYKSGAWATDQSFTINISQPNTSFFMNLSDLTISGKHNTYNSMAAAIVANTLQIRNDVIRESLMDFTNVEHRLEYVSRVKGMDFINDSKATNVNAAWYALECMSSDVVWIAGGIDKGNKYKELVPLVKEKVRVLICLGKNNISLHEAFSKHVDIIINADSAVEAVKLAYGMGNNGDTVLLSPACASFDLFENFEDRGRQFKAAVQKL